MTQQASGTAAEGFPDFILDGPNHAMAVTGLRRGLPQGALSTLAGRAAQFFRETTDGLPLLVGAVPYERAAQDFLFQPSSHAPARSQSVRPGTVGTGPVCILPDPAPSAYRAAVAEAIARIDRGEFAKVVLSRSLRVFAEAPHDAEALFTHLRKDAEVTAFSVPLPPQANGLGRKLIGATPELLVERRGRLVRSHPLAGSARRRSDAVEDREAATGLLTSDKDLREHAMAAEMVLDTLAPWCDQLSTPAGPTLTRTASMWHLGTRIEGHLRDPDTCCATLLALLHPTPAVCGLPRAAAEAALPALEPYDRGFYAGAVGWLEPSGDGCWYLALRCAEICGAEARLYAGAGIVAGSDPRTEESETSAKFLPMLAALGIDETGTRRMPQVPSHTQNKTLSTAQET